MLSFIRCCDTYRSSLQRRFASFTMNSVRRDVQRMSGQSIASLCVTPSDALVDEPVIISVTGLSPKQSVTLHARLVENDIRMASYGHFNATTDGSLDLNQQPCLSGSYTGVDPMGLFWSMTFEPGQRKGTRLMKKDVTTPYEVTVSVIEGHVSMEILSTHSFVYLCQKSVFRWYKGQNVQRKEIRQGNIRGTMFIPPGTGPFRGVIDIFGTVGGLLEYKASLMASRGFTTLALAWFNFEDLPKDFKDADLNYFYAVCDGTWNPNVICEQCFSNMTTGSPSDEAVDWFKSQPEVYSQAIGVMGVSKGSDFALLLGMNRPEVKAVVSIGGTPFIMFNDMKFGDVYLPAARMNPNPTYEETEDGLMFRDAFQVHDYALFDYSKIHGHVLFVGGDDDGTLLPGIHEAALAKLTPTQRSKFTSLVYPRTGHLIEPPYTPVMISSHHKELGILIRWGGDIPYHAKAQEDSWKRILKFFCENIPLPSAPEKAKL